MGIIATTNTGDSVRGYAFRCKFVVLRSKVIWRSVGEWIFVSRDKQCYALQLVSALPGMLLQLEAIHR